MTEFRTASKHTVLRCLLLALAFIVMFYGWNGILPHQLAGAVLFDVSLDNTFWIFHLSGLASQMHHNPWLVIALEILFLSAGVALFIRPHVRIATVFLLLMILLSLYMQTYSAVLTKISVILPVVFFPFCFRSRCFRIAWNFPRYYLVYLMVSAALFKVINGGLFHPGQMVHILEHQHADLALYGSRSLTAGLAAFLTERPGLACFSWIMVFLLESVFILLPFTRRADRLLAILLLVFCTGIWFIMRINTLEIALLAIPLFFRLKESP